MGQVVTRASSVDLDRWDDVVGDHVADTRGCIGVLKHSHDSVTLEVTLIHISLLFLLRYYFVIIVIIVWHLMLRHVPASWISSHRLDIIIVSMRWRGGKYVRETEFTWGLLLLFYMTAKELLLALQISDLHLRCRLLLQQVLLKLLKIPVAIELHYLWVNHWQLGAIVVLRLTTLHYGCRLTQGHAYLLMYGHSLAVIYHVYRRLIVLSTLAYVVQLWAIVVVILLSIHHVHAWIVVFVDDLVAEAVEAEGADFGNVT